MGDQVIGHNVQYIQGLAAFIHVGEVTVHNTGISLLLSTSVWVLVSPPIERQETRPVPEGVFFLMRVKFFFSTFIYTDLIYRVCCWKIQKLNTTETKKKIKKKRREKKSRTKGLNLTITKNGSIF